jgi:cytochrome c oxidase subunit IV
MTTTEHADHTEHHDEHHEHDAGHDGAHKSNNYYIGVAAALAAVTAIEVGLYYADIGKLFMPTLLVLMVVKFVTVVSLFMHLKFDHKLFSWLFYTGLFLAVLVYVAALMTFRFFDGG